jgi:hypothetical protein
MADHPILMSGPMVRALVKGRKTQTRRIVKGQPLWRHVSVSPVPEHGPFYLDDDANLLCKYISAGKATWPDGTNRAGVLTNDGKRVRCRYGKPGDRLWVREALRWIDGPGLVYDADKVPVRNIPQDWCPVLRPQVNSMFMPRWASRITLEITEIRVQRVQEISEEDAEAEGAARVEHVGTYVKGDTIPESFRMGFNMLWQFINGADSWFANPWVWAVSFKDLQ